MDNDKIWKIENNASIRRYEKRQVIDAANRMYLQGTSQHRGSKIWTG